MFPHEVKRHANRSNEFKLKGRQQIHVWKRTTRKVPEGVIHFLGCTACTPAHLQALDFESYRINWRDK